MARRKSLSREQIELFREKQALLLDSDIASFVKPDLIRFKSFSNSSKQIKWFIVPEDATLLERLSYKFCEAILIFISERNMSITNFSEQFKISYKCMTRVKGYHIKDLDIKRLISIAEQLKNKDSYIRHSLQRFYNSFY